jgi:hypothetical protein
VKALPAIVASLALAAAAAHGASAAPAKPKTYALVAAMGDVLNATYEVRRTGSHLPSYRHTGLEAPDNILNKLVLAGLDETLAKMEPSSQRIYLAVSVPAAPTRTTPRDTAGLEAVVDYLRPMAERRTWDRVIVATPAYSALGGDAMPSRVQGFGVFMQPLCQSLSGACGMTSIGKFGDGQYGGGGETVQTPQGQTIKANQFVAPYVYLKIWILDPHTLEVTDSQEVFEYQKLWDPKAETLDLSEIIPRRVLAKRIVELASMATEEAVKRTELRGQVEVKEKGPVEPKK